MALPKIKHPKTKVNIDVNQQLYHYRIVVVPMLSLIS